MKITLWMSLLTTLLVGCGVSHQVVPVEVDGPTHDQHPLTRKILGISAVAREVAIISCKERVRKSNGGVPEAALEAQCNQTVLSNDRFALSLSGGGYWSAQAIEALGVGKKLASKLEIICDLFATTTSPEIIQELIKRGVTARINRDLHAKVYFNEKTAIIGSANVSGPAFGLKGSDLQHEMCTRITDQKSLQELASWWADRWEESTPLDPNTPHGAQLLEHASYLRTVEAKAMDLWAAVALEPSNFKDVYLVLDWHSYGKKVAESVKQKQAAEPSLEVDAWEDWPDIPARAELMSFWSARGKGPVDYGFNWRSPDKVTLDEHSATYVTHLPGVRGYRFVFDDRMKEAVTKWRDKLMTEGAKGGGRIKLVAFARKYLSLKV